MFTKKKRFDTTRVLGKGLSRLIGDSPMRRDFKKLKNMDPDEPVNLEPVTEESGELEEAPDLGDQVDDVDLL